MKMAQDIHYPDLKGKIVLVTGSSKALGAETARRFASAGAKVIVHGRDEQAIANVVGSIESKGGECFGVAADVTSAAGLNLLQSRIRGKFGHVDILAAFAGGMGNPVPILDMTEEHLRKTMDVGLHSKFLAVNAFAPDLKANG